MAPARRDRGLDVTGVAMRSDISPHYYRVRVLGAAALGAMGGVLVARELVEHRGGIEWLKRLGVPVHWYSSYRISGAAAWRGAVCGVLVYLLILAARLQRSSRASDRRVPVVAAPVATPSPAANAFVWFAVSAALAAIIGTASGLGLALLLIPYQPLGVLKEMESQMADLLRHGTAAGAAVGLLCGLGRLWLFRSILGAMALSAGCGLVALALIWPILGFDMAMSWSLIAVIAGAIAGALVCPKWIRP